MICLTSCLDSASQSYSLCINALLYITSQINLSLQGRECAPGMLEFEPTSQEKECTGHAAELIKTVHKNQPTHQGKNVETAQWEDK